MSRSKRKQPIVKMAHNVSNKKSKTLANKLFRRINKLRISKGEDPVEMRELTDVWDFKSDGLASYRHGLDDKYMRK